MAMEVTCGQCHGRLLIETPGVVVACPHCGVHLSIPAPEHSEVLDDAGDRLSPELIPAPPSTLDRPPSAGALSVEISPMEAAELLENVIEGDTAVEEPAAVSAAPAATGEVDTGEVDTGEVDTGDIELNFGADGGWSPNVTDEPPMRAVDPPRFRRSRKPPLKRTSLRLGSSRPGHGISWRDARRTYRLSPPPRLHRPKVPPMWSRPR